MQNENINTNISSKGVEMTQEKVFPWCSTSMQKSAGSPAKYLSDRAA